jgi:hypothetical protein
VGVAMCEAKGEEEKARNILISITTLRVEKNRSRKESYDPYPNCYDHVLFVK